MLPAWMRALFTPPEEPPQNLKEYDPDGLLMGALSDLQATRALELLAQAGVAVDYRSFDRMGHSMHGQDPQLFTDTLVDWATKVPL